MKLASTLIAGVLVASAKAQKLPSVSLGIDSKSVFSAVEYPVWFGKIDHSTKWTFGGNAFVGSRMSGGKGLGGEVYIEDLFYSLKIIGIPVASASAHLGIGPELFEEDKPRFAVFVGISGRVGP